MTADSWPVSIPPWSMTVGARLRLISAAKGGGSARACGSARSPEMRGTITFFEVDLDSDYQYFLFEDTAAVEDLIFDGHPQLDTWSPPAVYSYQPRLREGDFWDFGVGSVGATFAVRPEALEAVEYHLSRAGELLPFPYQGREFVVVNITECIDALDHDATTWVHDDRGRRHDVRHPVFRLDRLSDWSSLFKIPETAISRIYCWQDDPEAVEQFKSAVEIEGLTGLVFKELYSASPTRNGPL